MKKLLFETLLKYGIIIIILYWFHALPVYYTQDLSISYLARASLTVRNYIFVGRITNNYVTDKEGNSEF